MTKKDFLKRILENKVTEEVVEFARKELEKEEQKDLKRLSNPTTQQKENAKIAEKILEFLQDGEKRRIDEILSFLNIKEMTRQRLSAICTNLVKEGKIFTEKIRVKNVGTRAVYFISKKQFAGPQLSENFELF